MSGTFIFWAGLSIVLAMTHNNYFTLWKVTKENDKNKYRYMVYSIFSLLGMIISLYYGYISIKC